MPPSGLRHESLQGPAAERLANPPVPSVATSLHGHMQNRILRWCPPPPRNASCTVLVHQAEELGALGSLQRAQHKQCDMSQSSSNTLRSPLRHNQVPSFLSSSTQTSLGILTLFSSAGRYISEGVTANSLHYFLGLESHDLEIGCFCCCK